MPWLICQKNAAKINITINILIINFTFFIKEFNFFSNAI